MFHGLSVGPAAIVGVIRGRRRARFWAFALAALAVGFLRELPRGNQATAVAKLRGALAG